MARMKQRYFPFFVALITILASREITFAKNKCLECHRNTEDKPSALFLNDIHNAKGITCAGCHGGNPNAEDMEKAMDKKAGFIGVPKGDDISKVCASCHSSSEKMKSLGSSLPTNQWDFLQTSVHAKFSLNGKAHIAQCITCHNAHGIVSVKNPSSPVYPLNIVKTCSQCHANITFMKSYNPSLPVDQLEKYRTSVHGMRNAKGDSKTAECASCHGSHDIRSARDVKSKVYASNLPGTCAACHSNKEYMKAYHIPTDQYEKYTKSIHGIALLQKHDAGAPACNNCHGNHGAVPPGVESVSNVCGTCHALNADLFSSSPHKKAFDQRNLPECETCHSNHEIIAATDKLLGVDPQAVCSHCHSKNQNVKGYQAAMKMRELIDSLETEEKKDQTLVNDAEQKGMEISEAKFHLRDVRQARLQSRTAIHAFNEEKFADVINNGLKTSAEIIVESEAAIHEYYFRRIGLAVITGIIIILAISLFLFLKRIESKQGEKGKK
jgi:predicted CXXCH cytochrome family protein